MNERLIRFTKLVLDFMFYSGWIVFFTLPLSLKFLGKYYSCIINDYACNLRRIRDIWDFDYQTAPQDDEDGDTGVLFCV